MPSSFLPALSTSQNLTITAHEAEIYFLRLTIHALSWTKGAQESLFQKQRRRQRQLQQQPMSAYSRLVRTWQHPYQAPLIRQPRAENAAAPEYF
jgi:hypothetical protein